MVAFTSAPFSSSSHTVNEILFLNQTATYKGVNPPSSLSLTRSGLACTHYRSSASFMT
jgi:hypothetical protein